MNSIDPAIQFIVKGNQDNGAPFPDTLVTPQADHFLSIQFTTNPPILTSTCNGIVTIIYLLSTLS